LSVEYVNVFAARTARGEEVNIVDIQAVNRGTTSSDAGSRQGSVIRAGGPKETAAVNRLESKRTDIQKAERLVGRIPTV
jgi:hypothetical protein